MNFRTSDKRNKIATPVKYLGVILHENLTWQQHFNPHKMVKHTQTIRRQIARFNTQIHNLSGAVELVSKV